MDGTVVVGKILMLGRYGARMPLRRESVMRHTETLVLRRRVRTAQHWTVAATVRGRLIRVGRPPIRMSLLLLLLLLLLRLMLLGGRVLLLLGGLMLLRWMLRMSVRMRRLSDVSRNVSAVSVRANRHFHVIVFIWRSWGAGGAWRLIRGIVTATSSSSSSGSSVSAPHRADAGASGAGSHGGGGR